MFGKKSDKSKRSNNGNLSQFGLFDIPNNFNPMDPSVAYDDGDSDLEAELAAIAGTDKPKSKQKKPLRQPLPQKEIDALVASSLKDDDFAEADDDIDENDPELLSELQDIAGDDEPTQVPEEPATSSTQSSDALTILTNRLKNYTILENDAKSAGETSKAKRYGRAIKTLNDLIKKANAGKIIDLSDDAVPPEVTVKPKTPQDAPQGAVSSLTPTVVEPTRPAPQIPSSNETVLPEVVQEKVTEVKKSIDENLIQLLNERQKEYKVAAITAKKSGDIEVAINYMKISKRFDVVIEAVKNGETVDLSDMPPSPGEGKPIPNLATLPNDTQKSSAPTQEPEAAASAAAAVEPELISANTIEEALIQRLTFYKSHEEIAKNEDNSSKARRFGRIVKQYEQALKAYKAGKTIQVDELPTPPGFAPIPVVSTAAPVVKPVPPPSSTRNESPKPIIKPELPSHPAKSDDSKVSPSQPSASRMSGNKVSTTHQSKQILILQAKQKQFKLAALNAKKNGELMQAKEFLRQAKGFDKLIEAAEAGLPVDWSSIPISPEAKSQLDNEYDLVMTDECTESNSSDSDVLTRLEVQLNKQLKMCLNTRDHHKALGDISGTNRFERLALNVTKDLDVIRMAKRTGSGIPKFHYETKDFSIVKSFTDLNDNELELFIVRGINYRSDTPKDIDTYVKFEFGFPTETPIIDKTQTIKDTNNPNYSQTFMLPIQRSSRQCQRFFKRHGIKFEIYSKAGFFRSDVLLGTINLKLQPLETQCEIHDSFDLMDGRRKTGGKLEIRLRLRNPILTKQMEEIHEKWLIIDQ